MTSILGWAKEDVWGLGVSFPFAKMILPLRDHFAKEQLATIHYDLASRPQRSCFANPNQYTIFPNIVSAPLNSFRSKSSVY